jgi:protein transport protein SEC13
MVAPGAPVSFDSTHSDQIHCAELDYYGRRVATCSSDRTIKIFDVAGESHVHLADLRGHEGPVWQVAWAHPKFGSLLASCSFDHRVIIWKEAQDNQWQQV